MSISSDTKISPAIPGGSVSDSFGWFVGEDGEVIIYNACFNPAYIHVLHPSNTVDLKGVFALSSREAWAVGSDKVYHTRDGGSSWSTSSITSPGTGGSITSVCFVDASDGWITYNYSGNGYILSTTDGGTTWSYTLVSTSNDLNVNAGFSRYRFAGLNATLLPSLSSFPDLVV